MSRWDGIIFRNGEFVTSISIELSDDWVAEDYRLPFWGDYESENLQCKDSRRTRKGLSHETVVKILTMLPSLLSIDFTVPSLDNTAALGNQQYLLYSRLKDVTSNLPRLRHLGLDKHWLDCTRTPESHVTGIIKCLPLLESLRCTALNRSTSSNPTNSFEWNLAQLSNLSTLDLLKCSNIDGRWCTPSWPKKLTKLKLPECYGLSVQDLHQLVSHLGSNLIELEIRVVANQVPPPPSTPNDPNYFFNLPSLTILKSDNPQETHEDSNLLAQFQNCKQLSSISEASLAPSQWTLIADLVCAMTWPRLQFLNLQHEQVSHPTDWNLHAALFKLRKFCDQAGIDFYHPGRNDD